MRANIDTMLTSSSVAVKSSRPPAGSDCWLAMLPSAGKDCWTPQFLVRTGAQFLRSQPIGVAEPVRRARSPEALRVTTNRRFDGPQLLNSTPVGARLWNFPREWDILKSDRYVRSIVRDGYRVELMSPPPLSLVPIPMKLFRDTEQSNALLREIMSLLDKGAIEELDPRSIAPGFYSRLFLVPKTDGSYRPVFDLKSLNQFVHKEKFKMTTPRTVTNAMHKGDWAVSIDLKDAYLHVPIHVRSQTSATIRHSNERRAPSFPIQGSPVRSDLCPSVFYQGNSSVGAPCASARRLPSSVSRRLATEKSKQVTVGSANKLVARCHSSGGVCAECGQVTTNTHATSDTHRCGISSRPRSDVPSDDTSSKVRGQDIDTYVSADHDSLLFPVSPRTPELNNRCNPTRQVASQTSAPSHAVSLGTGLKGPKGPDPSEARPVGPSPPLVVGQEVHHSRNATGHSRGSGAPLYTCVRVGLREPIWTNTR